MVGIPLTLKVTIPTWEKKEEFFCCLSHRVSNLLIAIAIFWRISCELRVTHILLIVTSPINGALMWFYTPSCNQSFNFINRTRDLYQLISLHLLHSIWPIAFAIHLSHLTAISRMNLFISSHIYPPFPYPCVPLPSPLPTLFLHLPTLSIPCVAPGVFGRQQKYQCLGR